MLPLEKNRVRLDDDSDEDKVGLFTARRRRVEVKVTLEELFLLPRH